MKSCAQHLSAVLAKESAWAFPWGNSPCHPTTTAIFGIGDLSISIWVECSGDFCMYLYRILLYFIFTVPRVPLTILLRLLMP